MLLRNAHFLEHDHLQSMSFCSALGMYTSSSCKLLTIQLILEALTKGNPLLEQHNSSSSLGITFLHWGLWAFIDHFMSLHQVDFMSCNAPALRQYPTRNSFVEGRFRKTSHANLMQEITPEDPQIIKAILAKVVSCYIKKTV